MSEHRIVTVNHTIMEGTVVRWFKSLTAAEHGSPVLSASRHGVMIHGPVFLHELPQAWISQAELAAGRLATQPGASLAVFATYRRQGLHGPLTPVNDPTNCTTNDPTNDPTNDTNTGRSSNSSAQSGGMTDSSPGGSDGALPAG